MNEAGGDAPDPDPIAAVEAWRARGAAPGDPVRLRVIEALARRAAAHQGEARRLLARRVEQLLAEHEARHAVSAADQGWARPASPRAALAGLSGLTELVDRLGRSPAAGAAALSAPRPGAARPTEATSLARLSRAAAPGSLKAVTAFKSTWARLRAEQRLCQALAQVPANAGPLNSARVVHRTLQEMRRLSPEYLEAFMAHVDTLLWLEQASGAGDLAARPAPRTEAERRRGVRPARKA